MSRRSGRKQFRAVMVRQGVTGAEVLARLRRTPGFLTEHAAEIDLPYADSDDGTVSVSRIRQEAMRKQISSLSESLSDTRDIAEGNQEIADIFFRICRAVFAAESVGELSSIVNETCRTELLIPNSAVLANGGRSAPRSEPDRRFFLSGDIFEGLMESSMSGLRVNLGPVRSEAEAELFFGEYAPMIRSRALVLLGADGKDGIAAFGHGDPDHYNMSLGTELLEGLTGFIGAALAKLVDQGRDAEGRAIAPISVVE